MGMFFHRAPAFSSVTENQKVDPRPGSLSTPISPPIISTIFLEMVNPSPVPPNRREMEASVWEKGSPTASGAKSTASSSIFPASILEKSRRSLMSDSRMSEQDRKVSRYSRCSGSRGVSPKRRADPTTAFMGLRISWAAWARNSLFRRAAVWADFRAFSRAVSTAALWSEKEANSLSPAANRASRSVKGAGLLASPMTPTVRPCIFRGANMTLSSGACPSGIKAIHGLLAKSLS